MIAFLTTAFAIAYFSHNLVSLLLTIGKLCKNNNFMLRGRVSAGFCRYDVLFLQGKHNGFRHIVASAQSESLDR